jgi:hypothetical protein
MPDLRDPEPWPNSVLPGLLYTPWTLSGKISLFFFLSSYHCSTDQHIFWQHPVPRSPLSIFLCNWKKIIGIMSSTSPLSGTVVPAAARVVTLALSMVTTVLIAFCLSRRISVIKEWRRASVAQWLIIGIYVDSLLFIVSTTIMTKSYNINENLAICDGAVLLCKSPNTSLKQTAC